MQNLQQAIDAINVDLVKEWLRLGADANLVPLRGVLPVRLHEIERKIIYAASEGKF